MLGAADGRGLHMGDVGEGPDAAAHGSKGEDVVLWVVLQPCGED